MSRAQNFIEKHQSSLQEASIYVRNERITFLIKNSDKNKYNGYVYGTSSSGLASYVEPASFIEANNRKLKLMQDKEEDEEVPDEHIWLSLRNAASICRSIRQEISRLDPDHAADYTACETEYQAKLSELDARYSRWIGDAAFHTLLFADRFPFRYLCADYGIDYYAAFSGCSAETEASFETIAFLAEKVDALNAGFVCVLESSDCSIAEAVIRSTKAQDQKIITLNSLQSVTAVQAEEGVTYLSTMQENYETLKEALET